MIESFKTIPFVRAGPVHGPEYFDLPGGTSMPRVSAIFAIGLCAVFCVTKTTTAQTTNATIVGDVSDPDGGRIAGADITGQEHCNGRCS